MAIKKTILSSFVALVLSTTVHAQTIANEKESSSKKLLERFHLKGDLRLCYESKETYYKDETDTADKYTYHTRYRLRLVATVDVTQI